MKPKTGTLINKNTAARTKHDFASNIKGCIIKLNQAKKVDAIVKIPQQNTD
jgi:hypothetical protein